MKNVEKLPIKVMVITEMPVILLNVGLSNQILYFEEIDTKKICFEIHSN